jgi:hypothetical protein
MLSAIRFSCHRTGNLTGPNSRLWEERLDIPGGKNYAMVYDSQNQTCCSTNGREEYRAPGLSLLAM